jgi:CRP/FNR family transcriptional regulator
MQAIKEFFSHYTSVSYKKGERIIREHENPNHVFFIIDGIVRKYLISEEGEEFTALLHPAGSIFPLRWLLPDTKNIYNFDALTDVEVYRAPQAQLHTYLLENKDSLLLVTQQLLDERNSLIYRLQHTVFGNASSKVASALLIAAKQFENAPEKRKTAGTQAEVPLTHQQIADLVGITRETTSVELKKLENRKLITYQGRTIVINDPVGLRKVSLL